MFEVIERFYMELIPQARELVHRADAAGHGDSLPIDRIHRCRGSGGGHVHRSVVGRFSRKGLAFADGGLDRQAAAACSSVAMSPCSAATIFPTFAGPNVTRTVLHGREAGSARCGGSRLAQPAAAEDLGTPVLGVEKHSHYFEMAVRARSNCTLNICRGSVQTAATSNPDTPASNAKPSRVNL